MSDFCFSTFIFGNYQKFIPYYIYSISKAYPQASIKIFIDNFLDKSVLKSIDYIRMNGYTSFEVITLNDDKINVFKGKSIRGGEKKLMRWLFGIEYFKDFEYVYFGDVDIFYLREVPSLMEVHTQQMEKLNLPFSNKVRINANGESAQRLTGLHCVKVAPYFESIQPIIDKILVDVNFRNDFVKDISRDEHFLFKICKYAFNFNEDELIKCVRPWHGVHLGITRGGKKLNHQQILENSSMTMNELKLNIDSLMKDNLFKQIQNEIFLEEFYHIMRGLNLKISPRWIFKYWRNNFLRMLKKMK